MTDERQIHCRSADAEDLEFNLCEVVESTGTKSSNKQSVKAGHQFDDKFGVGDTVTVVVNGKTDAENKVFTLSLQTVNSTNLNLKLYVCKHLFQFTASSYVVF